MSTNQGLLAAFAAIGALAAVFVVVFAAVFAALAAYDAVSGSNMADDMGNMMKDMGGMMDDGRGDVMDGMMGGRGPETTGSASGRGGGSHCRLQLPTDNPECHARHSRSVDEPRLCAAHGDR